MNNSKYISYLNTLHNYNAQNPNSYGEKNVDSPFFNDVMVKIGLSDYIVNSLKNDEAHIVILTGHAGDGKTSIMYQVLNDLRISFDPDEKINDYLLPTGRTCRCIKDFSEFADDEKAEVLSEVLEIPLNNNFVFMVANTGPLINTFGELFNNSDDAERAKIELIEAMDSNTCNITQIRGYNISVINVATVDNTYFAVEFLDKITQDKLWSSCSGCVKEEYCHILRNRKLIKQNFQRVSEFMNMHYVWITEHGKRLTIRSMTEQIAYMLTGGMNCDEVVKNDAYKYLFSNLFFGYIGTAKNKKAINIVAIKEAQNCRYDNKRHRSDEILFVNHEYNKVFGKNLTEIIVDAEIQNAYVTGWKEFLRRTYLFMNIVMDEDTLKHNYEDVFSKQFIRYLALRNGETTPSKSDANLICDALSMIYVGTTNNEQMIPLTLSRESGIAQNVQLITGTLMTKSIKLVQKETKDNLFIKNNRFVLKLEINKKELKSEITLPLLNYFEELKNGIISTNVDPQLSHGIESLKAELTEMMDDSDDDSFEMIILRNSGAKPVSLEITDNGKIREV